ncbi:MAG: hypothetical protein AAB432_02125 [Patescibacteria group bacterium]
MTTLIKNGLVYDGSGNEPVKTDIFIRGERVTKLGSELKMKTARVIDANGAIVMPGFIDINTNSDHYLSLFNSPEQKDFIREGVTTIIGGNCGVSLAPILRGHKKINVHWQSVANFLDVLEKKGVGVNFGTLIGYTTIRKFVAPGNFGDFTNKEIELSKKVLAQAFKDGAFGFSTDLTNSQTGKIALHEIKELTSVTAAHHKIYAVHLKNYEAELGDAVNEIIQISRETHVNTEVSHFTPTKNFAALYTEAASIIEKNSAESWISFDFPVADSTVNDLITFLPEWLKNENFSATLEKVLSKTFEKRILEHLESFSNEEITIGHVAEPSLKFLEGKNLRVYAESRGENFGNAFLELARLTKLKAVLFRKNVDLPTLEKLYALPNSIIASNGASFKSKEFNFERNYPTFLTFLKTASEKNILPFEKAVMKITALPAKKYGILKRGLIKENYFADIVVMKDFKPIEVLINGRQVLGTLEKAGKILRSKK